LLSGAKPSASAPTWMKTGCDDMEDTPVSR
jgi:hypothetical protein